MNTATPFKGSLGRILALTTALTAWWGVPGLQATSYVPMTDEALADQAPLIAEVEVLARLAVADSGPTVTDYRMRTVRAVKGVAPGEILVRVPGGTRPDGSRLQLHASPRFEAGQRALLFLVPHADGRYRILQFMLGAFHVRADGDRAIAIRGLSEALAVGGPSTPERPRDLERFVAWLSDRARGRFRPADFHLKGPSSAVVAEPFTLLGMGRWTEFTSGGSIPWRAHQSGQNGMPAGGFGRFQAALSAYSTPPGPYLLMPYEGTTTVGQAITEPDGINAIVFDDPANEIAGAFDCNQGGVLAVGGYWTSGTVPWKGQTFGKIVEAGIVTQNGAGCFFGSLDGANGEEVFGHELGHTVGLGHSCGDSGSGPCDTQDKDRALMRAFVHGDGRGAMLGIDDRQGLSYLYQEMQSASLSFSALGSSVGETAGTASVPVRLTASSGPLWSPVTVYWEATSNSATAGSDFTTLSGSVTFPVGSVTGDLQAIGIAIVNDAIDEADESFTVTLTAANAILIPASPTHTVTLLDDDAPPTVTITDASVTEGNAGTVNATFTVALSHVKSQPALVSWSTGDGTATSPSDYTAASGFITFAPGETVHNLTVAVKGDVVDEANESFQVLLLSANDAILADNLGQGLILDDDSTVNVSDAAELEGVAGPNALTFTVSLSKPNVQTISVPYSTADGSASAGSDYVATSGTLTFLPGEVAQTVPVTVSGDLTVEADETVFLNLGTPTNAALGDAQGVGTIVNDDPPSASALADFVMLSQIQKTTVSDTETTRWFKARLVPGRSYSASAWAPGTDPSESPVSLGLAWFADDGTTPAGGTLSVENEPVPVTIDHGGAATSILPTGQCVVPTGCTYRLRLQATGAVASLPVHVQVMETTLASPYWVVVSAAGYDAAPQVRNNTPVDIPVTFTAYSSGGSVVCSNTFTVPAHGLMTFGLAGAAPGCSLSLGFGSARLAFHGPPGSITANITNFSALSGLSFDAPFRPRNTWTSLHTK